MNYVEVSPETMQTRLARFLELRPLPSQQEESIPQEALDIVYARKLLPVIGIEEGDTPITANAPIVGAGGITITLAVCPPNQGPGLHAHKDTFETFTVLQGQFELRWGTKGEDCVQLGLFDTLSIPPGVARAFRNISDGEGVLQVVISGGAHNMQDIHMPLHEAARLFELAPEFSAQLSQAGVTFDQVDDA